LFLICGIGADCVFIIFEFFKQAKLIYRNNNRKRLAYAVQRGLTVLVTSITTSGASFLATEDVTKPTDTDTSSASIILIEEIDYSHPGPFDVLRYKPESGVNAASIDISTYNAWHRFLYNYVSPTIYFYCLPTIIVFLVWAGVFGGLAFKMRTKSELVFLGPDHLLQRTYTLSLDGFSRALNELSFVFVWGIRPKPVV
jgi:hypothetical protein